MDYSIKDDVIHCYCLSESSPSDDEEDEEEVDDVRKNGNEDEEDVAPADEPHAMPMEIEPSCGALGSSSS